MARSHQHNMYLLCSEMQPMHLFHLQAQQNEGDNNNMDVFVLLFVSWSHDSGLDSFNIYFF